MSDISDIVHNNAHINVIIYIVLSPSSSLL